jgi:hypothetical protein
VFVLLHVVHPWLRSVKDQWNVKQFYSVLLLSNVFITVQVSLNLS